MKSQSFYLTLLVCLCPTLFFAQQIDHNQSNRTPSVKNLVDKQAGEIEDFKYYIVRLESALEESDQRTVDLTKSKLMEMIKEEIGQGENALRNVDTDCQGSKRLSAQKLLYERVSAAGFSTQPADIQASLKQKSLFADFIELMNEELIALQKQLENTSKH